MSADDAEQLGALLNQLADGTLTSADDLHLAEILRRDAQARRRYREFMALHADLQWDYAVAAVAGPPSSVVARASAVAARRRWRLRMPAMAAGLVAGVALLIVVAISLWRSNRPALAAAEVARLTDLAEVQWPEGIPPLEVGSTIASGPLRLQAGTAQLTFAQGAVVTLTGPAELELITPQRAFLRYGAMVSYVPEQARGFTVLSPHGQLVDLGTEFAVQVEPSGQTEVHVLTGEVQLTPSAVTAIDPQSLTAGYAARLEASASEARSRITQLPLLLDRFEVADTKDLNSRLSERQQGRLAPIQITALDSDAMPALRKGRLAIPFEGRTGRPEPVARVIIDHDFKELVGRRYTIAFKAYLPEMGSLKAGHWLAFVLEDGENRRATSSMSLAYEPETNFSLMLSPDWLVGLRVAAKAIPPKRVFPRNDLGGPYQVMIRVDETLADGPRLDAEVNGVPVITGLRVPLGAGRRLGFHTWVKQHSDARGWATIDDLCVSVDAEPEKTSDQNLDTRR